MATGGKSSKLGASSSSASTRTVKQDEKRKQCATRAENAKKSRPFQLINVTAHPRGSGSGTAVRLPVVVPPLHCAGSKNMATATAFPFPMAGVNGAAPLWSTAAALGAASRAAALTLSSLPATASADGPAAAPCVLALAPAPGQQPPPGAAAAAAAASTAAAAAKALALPVASAGTGVIRLPLVLAQQQAGAAGELVPLPLHFVGYYHHTTAGAVAVSGLPAPAVGIPLAAALGKIENGALGRMLSALMPVCRPPLRQHQSKKTGTPPPWWPTGNEDWWVPELLAHLDTVAALMMHAHAPAPPVPFAPSYSLRKAQKVALLVAIVKHLAPDFARIAAAVRQFGKLSVSETDLWHSALNNERAKCMRPVFILLPHPQQQQGAAAGGGGGSAGTPSVAGTGSVVVVHSGSAASDGCEQVANLPAGACASVSAPAADGGSRGEVIAAAVELAENEPQGSDGDGGGVVSAADALADAGDGITHNKQGAAVGAAAPAGHVRQVVAGGAPEMTTMQLEPEQLGGVPGDGDVAAAVEDDQFQVHPLADVEVEGHHWWHSTEELNRMFAVFESFGDDIWY